LHEAPSAALHLIVRKKRRKSVRLFRQGWRKAVFLSLEKEGEAAGILRTEKEKDSEFSDLGGRGDGKGRARVTSA